MSVWSGLIEETKKELTGLLGQGLRKGFGKETNRATIYKGVAGYSRQKTLGLKFKEGLRGLKH